MKLKKISLRTAVMIPLIAAITIVILVFVVLLQKDYAYLANEQGKRILQSINETTQEKLTNLMAEPLRINRLAAQHIGEEKLYKDANLVRIESYLRGLSSQLEKELPQLSVYAYGDELKRFVGIRKNNNSNDSLMLLDSRTNGKLVIYEGDSISSKLIKEYEGYDPTTRPWYYVLKNDNNRRWTDIYINYDEKMETVISSIVPIYDEGGEFVGNSCFDVKLSGISTFLKNQKARGTGAIFIVDKDWNLLAQSGEEAISKATYTNSSSGELMKSNESTNYLIREASKYYQNNSFQDSKAINMEIENKKVFTLISKLREPSGLDWMAVVVIPESDLMSYVKERQNTVIGIISLIALFAFIVGLFILDRVVRPIIKSSKAAGEISNGNFDTSLEIGKWTVRESEELSNAFNNMVKNLQKSFRDIKLSEEKYKTLVENLENSIYSLSPGGILLSMNTSFEILVGQKREDMIGKHYSKVLKGEEIIEFWQNIIEDVIKTKEKVVVQFEYRDFYNERKILMSTLLPMLNDRNELELVIASNLDITRLVEAHEEIRKLQDQENERLEALVKEKTEELREVMKELMYREKLASLGGIVSGIAHEINTPLGVAVSAASYLETTNKENIKLIEEGKFTRSAFEKYIEAMEETSVILNTNLSRAAELVKSFKLIAVNQSLEVKTYFNMLDYIKSVLISLKHEYKNTNVSFSLECPENLIVYSYSGDFSQILTNFIMNSLIHGLRDREQGLINIKVIENDMTITMLYSDNGHGIGPENLNRVFEPFFTTNRSGGGSGLGLSVVYNIVTAHLGGKISCYSKLNEGTTFIIEIPKEWGTNDEQ